MRKSLSVWILACAAAWAPALAVADPVDWPTLGFTQVVNIAFSAPTSISHAGDGSGRLFIAEQKGRIFIIQNRVLFPQPFLDISNRVLNSGGEQGLLGLAFPRGYPTNAHFYVNYTRRPDGATVVSRFFLTPDPNVADTNSEQILMVIPQPYNNHNGGQMAFGPDGDLYIGTGDGGSEGDPQLRGQNPAILLGKLLRIDVESGVSPYAVPTNNPFVGNTNYAPEIWALGLRNPWRFSFDRSTGDLYIGDVGQNRFEEIDFQPSGSPGGQNYGWRIVEGPTNYIVPTGFTNFSTLTYPLTWYDHLALPTDSAGSVIGGYVYRGPSEPRMDGVYFFGDFMAGWIWGLKKTGSDLQRLELLDPMGGHFWISTFGEDDQGRIYMADYYAGIIYRIQDTHQPATPVFFPPGGNANSNSVVISCLSPNAVVHYTTNGVDPTESDPVVPNSGIIQISDGATYKARAFRADLAPSDVAQAVYSFIVGDPIFTPPSGPITNNTPVSISSVTPGATFYYTTNGIIPTTNSLHYVSPLILKGNTRVIALGVASGFKNSRTTLAQYSFAQVAAPVFTPPSGPVTNGTSISISCATPGAVIYYTLDGSLPTTSSAVYSSPFIFNGALTVKAVAVASGYLNSAVATGAFSLPQTATPIFTPGSGPVSYGTTVSISCTTTGAVIYYTLDGSVPTTNSSVYSTPFTINGGVTVNAFAVANGYVNSGVQSVFYSLVQTATPAFAPPSGPVTNRTSIAITCATPGATIYYTVDGSIPTTNSPVYSAPVTINGGTIVNAFAVSDQHLDSTVRSVFYALVQTATPIFDPGFGPVAYGTSVSISCSTPGSLIYYTLDGLPPGTNSTSYAGPFTITGDVNLQAFATAPEHLDSTVLSVYYALIQAAIPTFDPAQGPITNGSRITISCASSNVIIRYTLDGNAPTTNSPIYTAPFIPALPMTLTARAYRSDLDPSNPQSSYYGLIDIVNTVVTTLAGGTTAGFTNLVGTLARFSSPEGICIDKSGNLYVADTGNNVIRKILPGGQVTTFAGTGVAGTQYGPATNAQFSGPSGVAVDSVGRVYVADGSPINQVCKIDTNGQVSQLAITHQFGNFNGMWQLTVDGFGNVYAGTWGGVVKILPNGTVIGMGGVNSATCYQGWCPGVAPAVDAATNIYAATGSTIWRIAADGSTTAYTGTDGGFTDGPRLVSLFQGPQDSVLDSATNLLISDITSVRRISSDGRVSTLAGGVAPGYKNGRGYAAQFTWATGLCADTNGNIYVADAANNCIRKISPDTAGIGIADDWQIAHFGHVGIDPNADPDHDGMSNYAEFWAGTDPLDSSSVFSIKIVAAVQGDSIQISWETVSGKTYLVKYSSDLVTWNTLGSVIQGTGSTVSIADSMPTGLGPQRFYRVFVNF